MRPAIVLPWKYLAQCNHRLMPVIRKTPRGMKAMLITAPTYRAAKGNAEYAIRQQWKGSPLSGPIQLVALCYFPDHRKRDASNYIKLVEDALSGIAYKDDSQIHRSVWELAGYDKDNARIEITVTPLEAA